VIGVGQGWQVAPEHFAERHGLFIIIALGESFIAIGLGLGTGFELDAGVIVAATLGIVTVSALWWLYFDVAAIFARGRLIRLEAPLERREGTARVEIARMLRQDRLHQLVERISTGRSNLFVLLFTQPDRNGADPTSGDRQPGAPRAIEANFVYWFMNARCTVPVGPLRCFATISSASPFCSVSWL
jgi:hypothetical protein